MDEAWFNNSRSFKGETNQELTPSPSNKARLRKSTKHRPGKPGGWVRPGSGARTTCQSTPCRLGSRHGWPRSTTQWTWVAPGRLGRRPGSPVSTAKSTRCWLACRPGPWAKSNPAPPGWPGLCLVDFLSLALSLGLGVRSWLVSSLNERLLLNQASSTV